MGNSISEADLPPETTTPETKTPETTSSQRTSFFSCSTQPVDHKQQTEEYSSYWTGCSFEKLRSLEAQLFKEVAPNVNCRQEVFGTLGTIVVERKDGEHKNKPPLVMMHGYGMANLAWALCVDKLSENFRVFLVEMHGHGRSHREPFPEGLGPLGAEERMASFLEKWCEESKMNEPFTLVGHSLGAMVSWRYSALYPDRVKQLILASPVGLPEPPAGIEERFKKLPFLFRMLLRRWQSGTTPMDVIRSFGPFGVTLVQRVVKRRVSQYPENSALRKIDPALVAEIIHQSWSLPRSGEAAMNDMLMPGAFAKQPLIPRLDSTDPEIQATCPPDTIPISLIYGDPEHDWMTSEHGRVLVDRLKQRNQNRFYSCDELEQAGHNLALDNPDQFCEQVVKVVAAAQRSD